MDFQTVLDCKPFVPSNPPSLPTLAPEEFLTLIPVELPSSPPPVLETIQEISEEETQAPIETEGRKRRRRRKNAAKRKQTAADRDSSQASETSLPTPPSSNPHTPLRTGFTISPLLPQVTQERQIPFDPDQAMASMVTGHSESPSEGPPSLRLLEATPVLPSFPVQEQTEDIPADILHAIASRARDRLAARIQLGWEEQQQAIAAAMRIQEAYSMHIEAQLEKAVLGLKIHLETEVDNRLAKFEEKWRKDMESRIKEAVKPPKKKRGKNKDSSAMDEEEMSTVVSQLHAYCKQICSVFSGLQVSQLETVESMREIRVVLESIGLLVPRRFQQPVMHPVPVFGGMPSNPYPPPPPPQHFGNGAMNMPPFQVISNPRIPPAVNAVPNATAKAPNAKVKPDSKPVAIVISKPVLVEGNQGSPAQPNHAKVEKENAGLQPGVADGRTDSPRL